MKSALLVIDVQRGLFNETSKPHDGEDVIDRINALSEKARQTGIPVIFVQHERQEGSLVYLSPSWELALGLNVLPTDSFERKTTPDAFHNTELKPKLDKMKIKHLIICGFASEFCVDSTVRRAATLGYKVTLVSDAHTTYDRAHAPAISIIRHENATLSGITSFEGKIEAVPAMKIEFPKPTAPVF